MDFQKLIQKKEEKNWNLHGIQIAIDGEIVEQYGDCKTRYPIYSATKTITSSAVGIAVQEGIRITALVGNGGSEVLLYQKAILL